MSESDAITVRLPDLYPKQRDVFYNPARIVVCEATTKAGKSVGGLHWLASKSLEDTERRTRHWVSPTYPEAEAAFDRLSRWMLKADPARKVWDCWKSSPPRIRFGCSFVVFKGADNPDRLYGPDSAGAVLDEASRMKHAAFIAVRSTCSTLGAPMRIIGNVRGRKNWAYQMARKAQAGESGMAYFKLTAMDAIAGLQSIGSVTDVLNDERLAEAKEDYSEATFRELYFAEATEDGSNPFGMQYIRGAVRPMSPEPTAAFGIDLARKRDWTVVRGLSANGAPTFFDRWQGISWKATEDRIIQIVGDTPAFADSTGVGDSVVENLNRRQPNIEGVLFTPRSKQQMMEGLAVGIQSGRFGVLEGEEQNELESFEFSHTGSGVKYSAPDNCHDDCVCGAALAWKRLEAIANAPRAFVDFATIRSEGYDGRPLQDVFAEKRKDPDWGFDE